MLSIEEKSDGITFKVLIQPRSSKNMIVGLVGDALKIKLTAAPVEGAANKMCLKYLAGCLGVSKSSLEIISGHTGRSKKILFRYQGGNPSRNAFKKLRRQLESLLPS